jgi:hypothetical protein
MDWFPLPRSGYDVLAVGGSNGSIKLISKMGKVEKAVPTAHTGCV